MGKRKYKYCKHYQYGHCTAMSGYIDEDTHLLIACEYEDSEGNPQAHKQRKCKHYEPEEE